MRIEMFTAQAADAMICLLETANLREGDILVVGCSTSEVAGHPIGSQSSIEIADAILDGICPLLAQHGVYLAAQCCEHLNRAIIIESKAALSYGLEEVNAVPQLQAGGAFATAAYRRFSIPATVEQVRAHAGVDIGDTLIGMHLKAVAVPVRTKVPAIGQAHVVCARTRPRYIGGERALYNDLLR